MAPGVEWPESLSCNCVAWGAHSRTIEQVEAAGSWPGPGGAVVAKEKSEVGTGVRVLWPSAVDAEAYLSPDIDEIHSTADAG
ncbi:hypothetical protein NDU88_005047 [Pleurodeles waltl]|uniref:Uncharacterized protein n=1 Tax=Pleurodeles waltl TaxID=8319 RepID=A0AAV7W6S5_PLEWA|nr:hypothetical protein NDU88_005047 [Pleurodeles waltl]